MLVADCSTMKHWKLFQHGLCTTLLSTRCTHESSYYTTVICPWIKSCIMKVVLKKLCKGSICHVVYQYRYVFICVTLVLVFLWLYLNDTKSLMSSFIQLTRRKNVSESMHKVLQNISFDTFRNYEYRPGIPDDPRFQPINTHEAWVFSAFHDTYESQTLIRVFGIQRLDMNDPVYCYILLEESAFVIGGKRTLLVDYHGNRLRVVSYECAIDRNERPVSVSLTFSETDKPTNNVRVFYPSPLSRNFTVCYAILFNFTDHLQIIQSVEFNKVLGAQHFFVYNLSVSDGAVNVLRHYQAQGWLTMIQWRIPATEIHYHGQVLAINDCVYRNKGASKYVVVQDTDDFIIPYQHDNWNNLIEKINADYDSVKSTQASSHKNLGTYIVESTFFQELPNFAEWKEIKHNYSISEEDENFFLKYSLTSMTHLKRLNSTFGQQRQKSFVRPEKVLFPDVHTTIAHRPLATDVKVNQSLALVHHHRFQDPTAYYLLETTSLRFMTKLLRLVKRTLKALTVYGSDG